MGNTTMMMSSKEDGMPLRMFKMFMECERVGSLEKRLRECIENMDYDRCEVICELIASRRGKLEIKTEDNTIVYFDIQTPRP